ncbi:758_t:CDS:2 [Diversispora eburnea]|uniref:758_t:CDS:1 n=1 Tax=Diversispora eburnea TaxID=1213867 RepID=A0A9N8V1Q1_9GLOM|nr:758_t:CDS:2 [Diversispora eburnea]
MRRFACEDFPTEHNQILNAQRKVRPLSPFTIYQPQLTSTMSILHRLTGAGLGVVFYGGAIAYALSGPIGLEFNSDSIVTSVANLPPAIKYIGKFTLALPFTYHSFNGIRHLVN